MDLLANITGLELRNHLVAAVGAIGLIWYYLCLVDLGLRPTPKDAPTPGFRQFQALSITTISVSLATYVGYVVGIPLSATGTAAGAAGAAAAGAAAAPAASAVAATAIDLSKHVTPLQWLSAALYVVSLVLAVWFYSRKKDETEPSVTGLAKSLLGFVAGVFSVGLNSSG